jgi:hypothetical protein
MLRCMWRRWTRRRPRLLWLDVMDILWWVIETMRDRMAVEILLLMWQGIRRRSGLGR